jgi:tRNA dimethylallyltransferase
LTDGVCEDCVTISLRQYNGEVINADSRQIYRGMNIGTGKVTQEEMQGIPHHLLNILDIHGCME